METIRDVFAYNIKRIRGELTQDEFVERVDMSKNTLQKWEAGNVPQQATLIELLEKLRKAGFSVRSETELFLDPDLIKPTPITPEQAIKVLEELVKSRSK